MRYGVRPDMSAVKGGGILTPIRAKVRGFTIGVFRAWRVAASKRTQLLVNTGVGAISMLGGVALLVGQRKLRSFGIWKFQDLQGTLLDVLSARLGGTCRALCWMFALKLPIV